VFAADNKQLLTPSVTLLIWTVVIFLVFFFIIRKYAFGPIAEGLEKRRRSVQDNIDTAESAREEAQKLLEEYRAKLAEARQESNTILERARRTGEEDRRRATEEITAERERAVGEVQRAIQAETRQSIDRIRREVAELTLLATEKVLARKLDEAEQQRLIDDALSGVDFSKLTQDV
jgi:F-type H+-transporting ATPase subunit b